MFSIPIVTLRSLAEDLLLAAGADRSDAIAVSDVLTWADQRGRFPQGTIWLEALTKRMQAGDIVSPADMTIDVRFPALAVIDADAGFGHVAARVSIDFVVDRAARHGVAIAAVRNSSHFGPCGYHAAKISAQGMVGLAATNAYPKVAVHGASAAVLGTNPLGFSAPETGREALIGDLSTGALAGSRVREAASLQRPLPPGSALDRHGRETTDATAFADGGVMLPFGGPKGSALGLLVEILTSVLAAGASPNQLGSMFADGPTRTSHFFLGIAVDEQFDSRLDQLRSTILEAPPADGMEVRLPGDHGHQLAAEGQDISLPSDTVAAINRTASRLGLGQVLG